jgi:hypothetical protein
MKTNELKKFSKNFDILKSDEMIVKTKFLDIEALVYYLKIIEWEFPGFSVNAKFNELLLLQTKKDQKGYVESSKHRFLIIARKNS